MSRCCASTIKRFCSRGKSSFFFEPVEFDFELSDFLIEPSFEFLIVVSLPGKTRGKGIGYSSQSLFLPTHHLIGMNGEERSQFVNGFVAFDSGNGDLRFEVRAIIVSLPGHLESSFLSSDFTTLASGLNIGEYYNSIDRLCVFAMLNLD